MTLRTRTAGRSLLSTATLVLGGIGIASVALRVILEAVRPTDECGTAFTIALEWLIWIAIVSAALALVLGVAGLVARSDRIGRIVVGMSLALVVGVLSVAGAATFVCGETAA